MMNRLFATSLLLALVFGSSFQLRAEERSEKAGEDKIQVLLVAGGCCHDYATQTKLLKEGIEKMIDAEVTVVFNPSKTAETRFEIYESDDWAEGYDCILHDECSAKVAERPYIDRILAAHSKGVPAVNLHCAMHSYRWGDYRQPVEKGADNAAWYEFIGVQSTGHGPQAPIKVTFQSHPITKGLETWLTGNEELYNNIRVYGATTALASGSQTQKPRARQLKLDPDAKAVEAKAVVVWTNRFGPNKTRVFSTTLGHNNETVGDKRYLSLVSNGILWAVGQLDDK